MKDRKQTLVINLIGGPCSGKSTISAELFARLKKMGVKCELCTEYIKERIYEENKTIANNQIALFGMEHYALMNKIGKVDVLIHDGSLINNIQYNYENNEEFNALIITEYRKFNNLDFFIKRGNIEYETYGRIHNYEQALKIDEEIKRYYDKYNAKYIDVESRDAVDKMIPYILHRLDEMKKENN